MVIKIPSFLQALENDETGRLKGDKVVFVDTMHKDDVVLGQFVQSLDSNFDWYFDPAQDLLDYYISVETLTFITLVLTHLNNPLEELDECA